MNKGHVSWIDAYKGVLIILVVLGHVIGGGIHLMPEGMFSRIIAEYVFKFIYRFHMSAFFFIAGVTFSMGRRKSFSEFLLRKVRRLLVPYFVFGFISAILYLGLSGSFSSSISSHATDTYYAGKTGIAWWVPFAGLIHAGGWPKGQGFVANSVLWFLPCLFSVEVVYFLFDRTVRNRGVQFLVASLLLLFVLPLGRLLPHILPWGLAKLPYYLPFFVMGRWMPPEVRANSIATTVGAMLLVVLVVGIVATPNAWLANESWGWSLVFLGLAIVGTAAFFCLVDLFDWRLLRICGTASMTIMLLHKFLVIFLQHKVSLLRGMIVSGGWRMSVAMVGITVATTSVCIVLDWLIRRLAPWMLGDTNSLWKT